MIQFNYIPHATQKTIHHDRSFRFRCICCGRRWGKTRFAAAELLDVAGQKGGLFAWIAPTYFIAERGIRALKHIAGEALEFKGQNPVKAFFTGAGGPVEIHFLSADSPDTILGEGYDGAVLDEAARIPKELWDMNIRPALADKQGWALLISTPRARNWFYDFHTRGKDGSETLYKSYTFSSRDNPYFPAAEWTEAERTTPEDIFRQEYRAEFLTDSAGVFRGIKECLSLTVAQPLGDIVVGCDLAKHTDFTVLIAMDRRSGQAIEMERFNKLNWPIQKARVADFVRKHNALLIMDATGVGDPIYDELTLVLPRVTAIKLNNTNKTQLVQSLSVAIEQRQIGWPAAWQILTTELERYEYEMTEKGLITYNAPSGYHDDTVIALALANSGRFAHMHEAVFNLHPVVSRPVRRMVPRRRALMP